MSYHIYTTPGIILKRKVSGEADTLLYILTQDLGLIEAKATGTRSQSSKLRGSLQEYSLVKISCVKGKYSWKITNAVLDKNLFFDNPPYLHIVMAQISAVLLKVIVGEMPQKNVYELIESGFKALSGLSNGEVSEFESLILIRLMSLLGYVENNIDINKYLENNLDWSKSILSEVKEDRIKLVAVINKALKESHL